MVKIDTLVKTGPDVLMGSEFTIVDIEFYIQVSLLIMIQGSTGLYFYTIQIVTINRVLYVIPTENKYKRWVISGVYC